MSLSSSGFYRTPKITWDREKVSGRPFYYFAYGASCSEVTIDTMTGEMRVNRVDILHDVGKSLNPAIDIGQIEGGFIQGMGWLTTEQLIWDSAGRLMTHAPSTYKIPTASDLPEDFRVALFESGGNREDAVYRSKAVGEPPLMLAISVFSADHRCHRQPEAGGDAAPRCTGDAGSDHARDPRIRRRRWIMRVWARLRDALDRHGKAVMVTVVSTRGSAPREAGARLVVHPDGAFTGTIGGGTLEWRALALAQAALANPLANRADFRKFALGPELGQCCGGQVELIVELIGEPERAMVADFAAREKDGRFTTVAEVSAEGGVSREVRGGMDIPPGSAAWHDGTLIESFGDDVRPVLLFGAGHVGRALILFLAQLPFSVTWIDQRPDAFPSHLPANVAAMRLDDPVTAIKAAPEGAFVLVMSHSHQLDLALTSAALADDRFPYVGLIGSAFQASALRKASYGSGHCAGAHRRTCLSHWRRWHQVEGTFRHRRGDGRRTVDPR